MARVREGSIGRARDTAAAREAGRKCGTIAPPRRRPSPQARLAARAGHVERRLGLLAREERRFRNRGFLEEALEVARERRYWEFVRIVIAEQRERFVQVETIVVH
jgi:hypothetical protein